MFSVLMLTQLSLVAQHGSINKYPYKAVISGDTVGVYNIHQVDQIDTTKLSLDRYTQYAKNLKLQLIDANTNIFDLKKTFDDKCTQSNLLQKKTIEENAIIEIQKGTIAGLEKKQRLTKLGLCVVAIVAVVEGIKILTFSYSR